MGGEVKEKKKRSRQESREPSILTAPMTQKPMHQSERVLGSNFLEEPKEMESEFSAKDFAAAKALLSLGTGQDPMVEEADKIFARNLRLSKEASNAMPENATEGTGCQEPATHSERQNPEAIEHESKSNRAPPMSNATRLRILHLKNEFPWYDKPMVSKHMEAMFPDSKVTPDQLRNIFNLLLPKMEELFAKIEKRSIRSLHQPASVADQKIRATLDYKISKLKISDHKAFDSGLKEIRSDSQSYRDIMKDKDIHEIFVRSRAMQLKHYDFNALALDEVKKASIILKSYSSIGLIEDLDVDLTNLFNSLGEPALDIGSVSDSEVQEVALHTQLPTPQFVELEVLENKHKGVERMWSKIRDEFVAGKKDLQPKFGRPGSHDDVDLLKRAFEADKALYDVRLKSMVPS